MRGLNLLGTHMLRLRHAAAATLLLLPVEALAQQGAKSATASMAVTAYVAPFLAVQGIAPAATGPADSGSPVVDLLSVRANVPHRVLVRPAASGTVSVRTPTGRWIAASAAAPMEFAGAIGDATHRVECRGAAGACSLVYELQSTDPSFPVRTTASFDRAAGASAVSRIATTS